MTITPLTVYLVLQADSLKTLFVIAAVVLGILSILAFFFGVDAGSDEQISQAWRTYKLKWWISGFVVVLALSLITPNTKTLCATLLVPAINNSQAVQKDFPELYELAVGKLKEQLKPAQ